MNWIIWILILGIVLIVISGVLVCVHFVKSDMSLFSAISLTAYAIVLALAGFGAIALFIVLSILVEIFKFGLNVLMIISGFTIVGGVISGVVVAGKFFSKKAKDCHADPECIL